MSSTFSRVDFPSIVSASVGTVVITPIMPTPPDVGESFFLLDVTEISAGQLEYGMLSVEDNVQDLTADILNMFSLSTATEKKRIIATALPILLGPYIYWVWSVVAGTWSGSASWHYQSDTRV